MVCSVVYGYSLPSSYHIHVLRLSTRSTYYGLVRPSVRSKEDRIEDLQGSISPRPAFLYTWIRCILCGCFFQLFIITVCDGPNVSNSSLGPRRQDSSFAEIVFWREPMEDGVCVELSSPQRLTTTMKGSDCPDWYGVL